MEWSDRAISLGARRLGESNVVLDVFTREQGRWSGLVHGGSSKRKRAQLEAGNLLSLTWKARVDEQLGYYDGIDVEAMSGASLLDDPLGLSALMSITALLSAMVPERSPQNGLFDATVFLISKLGDATLWPPLYVRWEVGLLAAIGYGLDLEKCAVTSTNDGLTHVSPRTGRAVSAAVAEPFLDRLLPLPPFLLGSGLALRPNDLSNGLALTERFLTSRALQPFGKEMPTARIRLVDRLLRNNQANP
jgi:DNA repair protein RecO (recombination protein O)